MPSPSDPTIIRSAKRRRTVALLVEEDGGLKVLAPLKTSASWIEAFVAGKAGWIARRRRQIAAAQETARQAEILPLTGGAALVPYLGQNRLVRLTGDPRAAQEAQETEGTENNAAPILLFVPEGLPVVEAEAQARAALTQWYKRQAQRVLAARLTHWAEQLGQKPRRFALSSADKRWGSCSADNGVRLSWRLIKAPLALIDYVAVHEICHIAHKNHGRAFWRMVERAIPDAKARRKALSRLPPA